MPAASLNLHIEQGASWAKTLDYQNPDGTPFNLTGYTARMHVREAANAPTTVFEMTTGNGRIVITPLTGKIELSLNAADTEDLPPGRFVYDFELVFGVEVTRLIQGSVTVTSEVTWGPDTPITVEPGDACLTLE